MPRLDAVDPAVPDSGLSPLARARWRCSVLGELAEPGYIDFALALGEASEVFEFAPTEVSPIAARLLSLEREPPWSQLRGDAICAESRRHVLEACLKVATHGGDAAVTTQLTGGGIDSVVVRKVFVSKASALVQLTCPTAVARLGAAERALRALDPAVARAADGGGVRVLVVDDNVDAATSMCELLEILGFETAVAFSGPQCLGVAALFDPRLAFIDFDMPGMDGCQALTQLRLQESEFRRRFICLTGRGAPEDHRKCRDAGFDELVTKPISIDYLMELAEPLVG